MKFTGIKAVWTVFLTTAVSITASIEVLHQSISIIREYFYASDSVPGVLIRLLRLDDLEIPGLVVTASLMTVSLAIVIGGALTLFSSILRLSRRHVRTARTVMKVRVRMPKNHKEVDVDLADSSSVLKILRGESQMQR